MPKNSKKMLSNPVEPDIVISEIYSSTLRRAFFEATANPDAYRKSGKTTRERFLDSPIKFILSRNDLELSKLHHWEHELLTEWEADKSDNPTLTNFVDFLRENEPTGVETKQL